MERVVQGTKVAWATFMAMEFNRPPLIFLIGRKSKSIEIDGLEAIARFRLAMTGPIFVPWLKSWQRQRIHSHHQ
jgi:hypothetical protein